MKASYTETRTHFVAFWDKVCEDRVPLIVHRKGAEDIAMLPAAELTSLQETAHLLRSSKNARRLLSALTASIEGQGEETDVKQLRDELHRG